MTSKTTVTAAALATMNEVWDPIGSEQFPRWSALIQQVKEQHPGAR